MQKKFNDFSKLWLGESISMFGAQISTLAIPLTAVLVFHASPSEMGILQALNTLPFFIFSLFIGAVVDQYKKRPLLIMANLGSILFLCTIPLFFWLELLTMSIVYIVTFLVATMAVIFELAYLSYLPSLVNKNELSSGNSKLEGSRAVAQMAGPSVAGILIQLVSAPLAILFNALTYIVSIVSLSFIKKNEASPIKKQKQNIFLQIKQGLEALLKHPILRALSSSTALLNFFGSAFAALYLIYVVNTLAIGPSLIGLIVGLGSLGALLGAFTATKLNNNLGLGSTLLLATLSSALGMLCVPLAPSSSTLFTIPILMLSQLLIAFGGTVYFISQVSLRQSITPSHLLGRVNASNRFISRGCMPLGGVMGGILGGTIGLKFTLILMAFGAITPAIVIALSPVYRVKKIDDVQEAYKIDVH